MRLIEALLIAANLLTLCILALPLPDSLRWMQYSALLTVVVAALQVLIEGGRWQMIPAYILAVLSLVWEVASPFPISRIVGGTTIILGIIVWVIAFALPLLFPIFKFPRPDGQYAIGTLTYHWTDNNRTERFTNAPNDRRELMVQIWYPAKTTQSAPHDRYIQNADVMPPLAQLLHIPPFIFGHLPYITTHAVPSADIAPDQAAYPVLIFSHGRGGYRQHNTLEIESLVSHGYIVAAIDHTYAATGVVFPDGRLVALDPRMIDRSFVTTIIPYLAQDAQFTLDQLIALNQSDPNGILTNHLDIRRVGLFGLSLGGEVTAEACKFDSRFQACLMMDVWMPTDVVESGLHQPAMWITRDVQTMQLEGWKQTDIDETIDTMRTVYNNLSGDGYFLTIPGMFHQDFSDAPFLSPLTKILRLSGPLDSNRAHAIVNAYTRAFFDHYLQDRAAPLLDGQSSQYPEVHLESRHPQSTTTS